MALSIEHDANARSLAAFIGEVRKIMYEIDAGQSASQSDCDDLLFVCMASVIIDWRDGGLGPRKLANMILEHG